jgi:CSLREA domain-containing protein
MRISIRCAALLLLSAAGSAYAQPGNDSWSTATVIAPGSLPFVTSEPNMYQATVEAGDPVVPCVPVVFPPASANNTLWYKYTPALPIEYLTLTIPYHSPVSALISVYTGNPTDGFRIVSGGCTGESDSDMITRIAGLRLSGGTTYSIEVASAFGSLSSNDALSFTVASSAIYNVTKTTDSNDGSCDSDCSLREAIGASNLDPGAVLIPPGTYKLTLPDADGNEYFNATGSLDALHGMGIYGAGMQQTVIDANNLGRALDLDPAGASSTHTSFAIADLTISNGHAVPAVSPHFLDGGGGLLLYSNSDYFGLERVALTSNQSDTNGGGGLMINSPGTIRDSIVSANIAAQYGGGGLSAATNDGRFIEISGTTISGNSVTDPAGGHGGGIDAFATLQISNSTISGNHAIGNGGGINLYGSGSSLHMASSTVVLNTAQTNPVHSGGGGAGLSLDTDAAHPNSIVDSILAYNTTANPSDPQDCLIFTDAPSSLTSSYNHVATNAGTADFGIAPCQFMGLGDVTGSDPGVSHVLGNNGGLTPTHALLSDSPAQDSGDPGGCRDAAGVLLAYDQRGAGFPRIGNGRCDKGAFEFIDKIFGNGFDD